MILIEDKIIHDDVVKEQFLCNLNACKGACCWEGDYGAPLEKEEMKILEDIYEKIVPYLTDKGRAVIETEGKYIYYKEAEEYGTPLVENAACAYMTYDETGKAQCGIELAHKDGIVDFKKPISCHLYPIRITPMGSVDALNYDRWDICAAACTLGKKEELPVYKFLKEPLIRKYGEEFYNLLDAAAEGVNAD